MSFTYPKNVLRVMYPQMSQLRQIVGYHFKRRHESELRKRAVKNWVKAFREADKASGFSIALRQVGGTGYRSV